MVQPVRTLGLLALFLLEVDGGVMRAVEVAGWKSWPVAEMAGLKSPYLVVAETGGLSGTRNCRLCTNMVNRPRGYAELVSRPVSRGRDLA